MGPCCRWLLLCTLGVLAASCRGDGHCLDGITINVILLEDMESPWSLMYVQRKILEAIKKDAAISMEEGKHEQKHQLY